MWRYLFLMGVVGFIGKTFGQEHKHFKIDHSARYKSVTLNYGSSSGTCYISPGSSNEPLAVFSQRDIDDFNHSFDKSSFKNNLEINLNLEDKNKQTFSQSISNKVFNASNQENNIWNVYLANDIPYNLNLVFGVGMAYIDLSGIKINNFKVRTGSADVNIDYLSNTTNPVKMDSFNIKVDLGNVVVRKLYKAKAKNVNAEVGFGTMLLDFTDAPETACQVHASVGAGTLEILIPKNQCSVKVKIKDSMLCDVQLTKSFREIEKDVYVNDSYSKTDPNQLVFAVDVSMGNIIFKEKR